MQRDHRPDLRLAAGLAVVTVVSCGGLVAWALSVRGRLPDPVARHWGLGGRADGFSSLEATLAATVGITAAVTFVLGAVAVLARLPDMIRRCLAGVAVFVASFVSVIVWDGLQGQVGLADPTLAPPPGPGIAIGTLVGVLAGLGAAALVTPRSIARTASARPPDDAPRLDHEDADAVWESALPGVDVAARVLAVAVGVGFLALAAVVSWWLLPMGGFLVVLLLSGGWVRVRIDGDGLRASALGLTVLHAPLEEVAVADVVQVDPFWEFGGWGLRIDTRGRIGLVTRKGAAVRLRRGDDSEVLVTLDDSPRAAATLNTLADRVHGSA